MVLSLGEGKGKMVVGSGVIRISMHQRPGSYDHHRAAALRKQGVPLEVRPPIWDWLVMNADGRGFLLHPRWSKKAKREITPLADAAGLLGTVPAKGVGRSDGRGTYRRATATFSEAVRCNEAPVETGPTWPKQGTPQPPPPRQAAAPVEAGHAAQAAPSVTVTALGRRFKPPPAAACLQAKRIPPPPPPAPRTSQVAPVEAVAASFPDGGDWHVLGDSDVK